MILVGTTAAGFFVRFLVEWIVLRGLRLLWKNAISSNGGLNFVEGWGLLQYVIARCVVFFFSLSRIDHFKRFENRVEKRHFVEGRSVARAVRCVL